MAAVSEGTWQIYNETNNPPRYFVTLTPQNVTDANEYYNIMQRNNRNDIWKFGDRYDDTNNANLGLTEATIAITRGDNNSITGMTVNPVPVPGDMGNNMGNDDDNRMDFDGGRRGSRKRSKKVKRSKKRATRRRRSSKNKSRKMNRRKRY
jgi:hypothetical protein